jgi:HlyD family secretion protein
MAMTPRPYRIVPISLFLGLAFFTVACDGGAPEVTVAAVARENLGARVITNGKVEPIAPSVLRARLDTVVLDVVAEQGRNVRAGDVILHLDVATAVAGLARAREEALAAEEQLSAARAGGPADEVAQLNADIRKNDAELSRLRREREALTRLLAKQAATQNELDENKLALDRAEAQSRLLQQKKEELARRSKLDVERAQLRLERARGDFRNFESQVQGGRLTSPASGTLYLLPVKQGDYVRTGDVLAEIADLSKLRVRVFVDEPEMGALETGQAVEFTWDALPGRIWRGKTETVPRAVVQRGSRFIGELLCSVDNKDLDLLPNTNVNVVIRVRERINTLVVPRASIRQDGNTRFVFVLEGTKLRRRDVKLGISSATKFEILEGLSEKDRVVIPGTVELHDGLEVRVKS